MTVQAQVSVTVGATGRRSPATSLGLVVAEWSATQVAGDTTCHRSQPTSRVPGSDRSRSAPVISAQKYEIPPQQEAESNFQQTEFGPFAASGASIYEDEDQAGEVLDLLADMANDCQSFTQVDEDGAEVEYTITPLSFPDLGEDTFAFRMSAVTFIGPLALDVAAVRQGPLVVTILHDGFGAVDSELTETLMQTMLDRV